MLSYCRMCLPLKVFNKILLKTCRSHFNKTSYKSANKISLLEIVCRSESRWENEKSTLDKIIKIYLLPKNISAHTFAFVIFDSALTVCFPSIFWVDLALAQAFSAVLFTFHCGL